MAEAESKAEIIVLGGRVFEPAQRISFGHHAWMMVHVHSAGLDTPAEDSEQLLMRAVSSGRLTKLLAGSLDEVGVEWTEDRAEENAKFFYSLTDPGDIQRLQRAIAGVLASFFLSTGSSSTISPSFSTASPERKSERNESAESSSSENSALSSESSPVTTPTESGTS